MPPPHHFKHITLMLLGIIIPSWANAAACPPDSVSCRPSFSSREEPDNKGIELRGMVSGDIHRKGSQIVINGATFISHNNSRPAISIGGNPKKNIAIYNSRVISSGFRSTENSDMNGLVIIDDNRDRSVKIKDLKIESWGAAIVAESSEDRVCAGVWCSRLIEKDQVNNVTIEIHGHHEITAIRK